MSWLRRLQWRLSNSFRFRSSMPDRGRTLQTARVKAGHAVSYADALAVALAQKQGAAVVTGDREFEQVEDLVPVRWIGRCAGSRMSA